MKRILALLLVLAMSFALCACGKKETEEQVVIISNESGLHIAGGSAVQELDDACFEILDVRLKKHGSGDKVFFDYKFECLFPEDKHEQSPDRFSVYYNLTPQVFIITKLSLNIL